MTEDGKQLLDDTLANLEQLQQDVKQFTGEPLKYSEEFRQFVERFNVLLRNAPPAPSLPVHLEPYDESSARYRANGSVVHEDTLENFLRRIEATIGRLKAYREAHSFHCFLVNKECLYTDGLKNGEKRAFIGMPFQDNSNWIRDVLKDWLKKRGYNLYRADDLIRPIHLMCKICHLLRTSSLAFFDITASNPNVMVELGFALGLQKKVVLLRKHGSSSEIPTDLGGLEYVSVEYSKDESKETDLINKLNNLEKDGLLNHL